MIFLTNARHVGGYKIEATFNTGEVLIVDLKDQLKQGVLEQLKDPVVFAAMRFDAEADTVVWDNGADFAPEFLYELAKRQVRSAG
jgi:hypothetical protein